MKTAWFPLVMVLTFATMLPARARAAGHEGALGLGMEFQVSGLGGLSATVDMERYHLGGFLGFFDGGGQDDTDVDLGGEFFYHVHSTAMSDFGLGGSIGIAFIGDRSPARNDNLTEVFLEPAMQIRAFVVSNVAVSFTGGLSIAMADAEGTRISGQSVGEAGVHYYFF